MNYGYGMSGGMGGSSTTMMMSSFSMICLCLVLAAAGFFLWSSNSKQAAAKEAAAAEAIAAAQASANEAEKPVEDDLSGARLLTVGGLSMVVEGDSCGNGTVRFSESKGDKWLWKLNKVTEYNGVPVYTIESFYKQFSNACDSRWLTAGTGCKSAPYLGPREAGPRQQWIIVGNASSGFQIRNLACTKSRHERQYLMQSAGNRDNTPFFSAGSGSTFAIDASLE
jgi:hypothetical protein